MHLTKLNNLSQTDVNRQQVILTKELTLQITTIQTKEALDKLSSMYPRLKLLMSAGQAKWILGDKLVARASNKAQLIQITAPENLPKL